jgi:Fe-S cluster biogenesis protein NfuA
MKYASLPQRLQQLEREIRDLANGADPGARERLRELVQTVLEWHGAALARLLELITYAGESGRQILQSAGQDELVRSLLLLYGLHAQDLESRVGEALDQIRPFLHSQGAEVELTAIAEDAVRLRLLQGGGRYPATVPTLRAAIEEAICAAAPDVYHVEFVDGSCSRLPLPVLSERTQ